MKRFFIGLATGVFLIVVLISGATMDRLWGIPILDRLLPISQVTREEQLKQRILTEESAVIETVAKVSPSVVTVSVSRERRIIDPFSDPFGFFQKPQNDRLEPAQQDIGTGFVIDKDGLIVTNKHVVSDTEGKYRVIAKDNKEYDVLKIYRDPANDIAILKIDASPPAGGAGLQPVEMGDSDNLKVGQFVIAIGTALGEFRDTVTTGVISGLGRGIQAGDVFGGNVEELDNVIQTDAAINPGNSGGPLLNSAGQVIGVNAAIAGGAENIGFAIPINVVKSSLETFNTTGKFSRAFFGIRYQMIPQESALLNNVPQGAYVFDVVAGSAAEKAGVKQGDIITQFDGQDLGDGKANLGVIIGKQKVGNRVSLKVWREGKFFDLSVTLEEAGEYNIFKK